MRWCATVLFMIWINASAVFGHEFWIEPEAFFVDAGDDIKARLFVGEEIKGIETAYIPRRFVKFEWAQAGLSRPVTMELGDRPAFKMMAQSEGVVTLVHQTQPQSLLYSTWEKFVAFCTEKDFAWAIDEHQARGLPQTRFRERYIRFAKSLIGVGNGPQVTQNYGMRYEFEVVTTFAPTGPLTLQLLFEGEPQRDVQATVFVRAVSGEVLKHKTRTNSAGFITIERKAGHMYLVDAVKMLPVEPEQNDGFAWESLWASITFGAQ